jgi:hypothetical protein
LTAHNLPTVLGRPLVEKRAIGVIPPALKSDREKNDWHERDKHAQGWTDKLQKLQPEACHFEQSLHPLIRPDGRMYA